VSSPRTATSPSDQKRRSAGEPSADADLGLLWKVNEVSLRRALLLAVAAALVVSLVLVASNVLPGWWLLFNSTVLGLALLFERRGDRPASPPD
jgi:hypothetical protein